MSRLALITGAGSGIGRASALALAARGWRIALVGRREDALAETAALAAGEHIVAPADIADAEAVDAVFARVEKEWGRLDIHVSNAGIVDRAPFLEMDDDLWKRVMGTNLYGAFTSGQYAARQMVAQGEGGRIVHVASNSGIFGGRGRAAYGASKAGVMSLAESLAADLRGSGVTVQLVNPGFIKTRLTAQNDFAMPMIMEAEDAARRMAEHMSDDGFERNFPTVFSWVFRLARLLPNSLYFSLFSR